MNSERNFSFVPAEQGNLLKLTPDEISQYNSKGYVAPFNIFSPEQVAKNRRYIDGLLDRLGDHGNYGINCFQARARGIWDLCTTPVILDHVQDIIGPDIVCWASHLFCKMPGETKSVPWHQDAVYWHLSPTRTVTVWLAIDDVDEENSAMRFLPGTHVKGGFNVKAPDGDAVLDKEVVGWKAMGEPYSNNLAAGQVSLHADLLVHGSKPNTSERRRAGLTLRYCAPSVRITDENWAASVESIICRGTDPSGNWKHHQRPGNDDIDFDNGPLNIGGN